MGLKALISPLQEIAKRSAQTVIHSIICIIYQKNSLLAENLWELLFADDLVIMADSKEQLQERLVK